MKRIFIILFFALFTISSNLIASPITINAQIVRNQPGAGPTFISSGFPFPPGLVTESIITEGKIKVFLNGTEVPVNVSALRGRHNDGTIRSALIQLSATMAQGDVIPASVIVDGGVRTYNDPAYQRPTLAIVQNNNIILPTSPIYLTSTQVTFQKLLPQGSGTEAEEKLYTELADDRFTALSPDDRGPSTYEDVRGMLSLWLRSGDEGYFNKAVSYSLGQWITLNTPASDASPDCNADAIVNPDGRPAISGFCGGLAEWDQPRSFSYAALYLLTGYRDFWSIVAYNAQSQLRYVSDQDTANSNIIAKDGYDTPRFNYSAKYESLLPAIFIDATIPVDGQWFGGKVVNWKDQLEWVLNAIKYAEWDLKWIPFNSGSGNVPTYGTIISQSGVSGIFKGVYLTHDLPRIADGAAMPSSGYIQINNVTGGSFSAGALTGITATASGPQESDYRQGLVGTRSDSQIGPNMDPWTIIPTFQLTFPTNFLIDYYLNVYADSRIPAMVKKNLDVILQQIRPMVSGDKYFEMYGGKWGNPIYGKPYPLWNPVSDWDAEPYDLPEYARIIAFVLKTLGEDTVNGASYTTWYNRCINTANVSPIGVLIWSWKNFGQFYGWGMDAPWMMAQSSLTGVSSMRTPTNYSSIPGEAPDLQRTMQPVIRSITPR